MLHAVSFRTIARPSPDSFSATEKPMLGMLRNATRHEYWWINPLTGCGLSA